MDNNLSQEIPSEILLYLKEIAGRLWTGHAAVMVGAGFSKNAQKSDFAKKDFPDWSQLGNVFYNKIYGGMPEKNEHYLNVLKLADEVQAAFGRPVLDQILRQEIPDKEYEPSHLHIKLMELPWSDVFTTNYDTLLERACISVISQKYDVVSSKEDLVFSQKPRIIKLHGSFPSERPFIITEEDYRQYPKNYAPFVNTVQQSLLENTLCLIGFSGDDPNFLQWIGWIQDNLGKENSPKIYLIGIFNLSHAQKKMLEKRNIVLLDFSLLNSVNNSHEKALSYFFNYLYSEKKSGENLSWPDKSSINISELTTGKKEDQIKIIESWATERSKYPNWFILPEGQRIVLKRDTERNVFIKGFLSELSTPEDINFLYELNWRLERYLQPIHNEWIKHYEDIIGKYDPFNGSNSELNQVHSNDTEDQRINWKDIGHKWLEIQIAIMRFYREEGEFDKWNALNDRMLMYQTHTLPELNARLHHERCMCAFFLLDIDLMKNRINEWPINNSLPLWEAKRASLLAEIGEIEIAEKILENSLNNIRRQLNLSPISGNYNLVSQESIVMLLLNYISSSVTFWGEEKDRKNWHQSFHERWNVLKQYKCDPWNELKYFEFQLNKESVKQARNRKRNLYDIGRYQLSFSTEMNDDTEIAYSYLRFCEEAGIPFRVPNVYFGKEAATGALCRMANNSPLWALITLIRVGDSKLVDSVFDREYVYNMNVNDLNKLIENYILLVEKSFPTLMASKIFEERSFAHVLATVLPEIISRLCVKSSEVVKGKILELLIKIYSFDKKLMFSGVDKLMERFIESLSERETNNFLTKLLEIPVLKGDDGRIDRGFPEPFSLLSFRFQNWYEKYGTVIDPKFISDLLAQCGNLDGYRDKACLRLQELYILNLLSEHQCNEFGKLLWKFTDPKTKLPSNTKFYNFAFLYLPCPQNVNPEMLLKQYILNTPIPIQSLKSNESIGMGNPCSSLIRNILGSVASENGTMKNIEWHKEEMITILDKLMEWWELDKKYLKMNNCGLFRPISEEFEDRFYYLVKSVCKVVLPNLSDKTNNVYKDKISQLINGLNEFKQPTLYLKAAGYRWLDMEMPQLILEIVESISSKIRARVIDAIYAILELLESEKTNSETPLLVGLLSEQIKWRCMSELVSVLNSYGTVVLKSPQVLTEHNLEEVLIGLQYLIVESSPTYEEGDVGDRLAVRKSAAKLAYILYNYYTDRGMTISGALIDWKIVCESNNEFAEIRNEWGGEFF